jgi:predicted  nucleic acid-binding Zn-ribbon protein
MTETKGDQIEELQRLKREVEKAREDRRGLEDKIASLKSVLEKAESAITALHGKSKKLDESLAKALRMASLRQSQLRKLQTGVLRFKLSAERLMSSEREMKDLAAAATLITDGPENYDSEELQVKTTDGDGPKS